MIFLDVEHKADGTLKIRTDSTLSGLYTKPNGGIPANDLTSATQTSLGHADSAVQNVNGKTGPSVTLIPGDIGAPTALSQLSDVNTAGVSNAQVLSYDTASGKWIPSTVSSTATTDATSASKGIVQLAGDLGGSNNAVSPTISVGAVTGSKIANGTITDANISASAVIVKSKLASLGATTGRAHGKRKMRLG
jgi:hypothetical protein